MGSSPTFEIKSDSAANVLRIRLLGKVDVPSMRDCVDHIDQALKVLTPGFRVLTDLSGIESMDTECIPKVKELMNLCRARGVQTVVRVIPHRSKDVGFSILSFFHYSQKVQIQTFTTLAEAEQALAS